MIVLDRWREVESERSVMEQAERCFNTLAATNTSHLKGEWILLIDGELVYHDPSEAAIYQYADEHFPDAIPCVVKVPAGHLAM